MGQAYGENLFGLQRIACTNTFVLYGLRSLEQLLHRALARRLVLAPALQLRAMADAPAADVVEGDLDDQLGPQRDPLQLLVALPAARVGTAALAARIHAESVDQLASLRRLQPGRVAHGPQLAVLVIEA